MNRKGRTQADENGTPISWICFMKLQPTKSHSGLVRAGEGGEEGTPDVTWGIVGVLFLKGRGGEKRNGKGKY